jgi:hypothetical protein
MASTTAIILTHQEDWEQWLADVQAVADDDIWPYINPDEPAPVEDSDSEEEDEEDQEERGGLLSKPEMPKVKDFDQNANTYAQLNAASRKAYDNARRYYEQDLKQYQRQRDLLREVRKYISAHVSPQKKLLLDRKLTVKDWLARLKETTEPTKSFMKRKIQRQYYESLKGLNNSSKINQWADKWEHAMELAVQYKLPQISDGNWLLDLAHVVRPLSDSLYTNYIKEADNSAKSKSSEYRRVAKELRETLQHHTKKATTARGSTFKTEFGDTEDRSSSPEASKGKARSQSRKRAGTNTIEEEANSTKKSKIQCPACEYKGHALQDCWILFENKRPEGYKTSKAKEARAKKVKERVAKDKELAAQVEKIRLQEAGEAVDEA